MEINSTLSYSPVFRKKIHSNLEVSHSILCKFPKFTGDIIKRYNKEIFIGWGKCFFTGYFAVNSCMSVYLV